MPGPKGPWLHTPGTVEDILNGKVSEFDLSQAFSIAALILRRRRPVAAEALAAIESEASQTLAEMRSMVRAVREEEAVAYSPQPGVADLSALAHSDATSTVEVSQSGSLARLAGPVDAALYRLAQESLTNAVRHGRGATPSGSTCAGGQRRQAACQRRWLDRAGAGPGVCLLGMAERAHLLGGSLSAGPGPESGCVVEAVLPVEVPA